MDRLEDTEYLAELYERLMAKLEEEVGEKK